MYVKIMKIVLPKKASFDILTCKTGFAASSLFSPCQIVKVIWSFQKSGNSL